ncbi:MAG: hypothetical protein ACI4QI_01285 [Candidatus Coproplasma sp.]
MENKKLFVEPEFVVVYFENKDVITASGTKLPGGLVDGGEFMGH